MIRRPERRKSELTSSKSSQALLGDGNAKTYYSYGFLVSGEGLRPSPSGGGDSLLSVASTASFVEYMPAFGLILMHTTGEVQLFDVEKNTASTPVTLSSGTPFAVQARDEDFNLFYAAVCADSMYVCYEGESEGETVSLPHGLKYGVMHCGRLFAADADDGYMLRWSGLRITDWTDGIEGSGYVRLDGEAGEITGTAALGDTVLILRERGITVLRGLADSRSFRIAPSQNTLFVDGALTGGGVWCDKYWFGGSDGLYSFDGDDIVREYAEPYGLVTKYGRVYVSDGYVYEECTYLRTSCILRYRISDKEAVFMCTGCTLPVAAGDKLYCIKNGGLHLISDGYTESARVWRSQTIYPAGGGRAAIKNFSCSGSGDIKITVTGDGDSLTFSSFGTFPVNLCGDGFCFTVSGQCRVNRLTARFGVIE